MTALPLVLVPGLLCDAAVWAPELAALEAAGPVAVADHGRLDSLSAMAERVLATAPPTFALAGHSMGGRVALEIVARAPERVARLALLDTGHEGLPAGEAGDRERSGRLRLLDVARREGMRAMGRDWLRGMVHPRRLVDAWLVNEILDMIARATPAHFAAQMNALLNRPDRTALLPTIAVPTLVLCGADDAWSPLARHRAIAAAIPGSTLVAVPDCGHMSTMEQPEALTRALLAWLTDRPQEQAISKEP